ncbi:Uncharacterised protein [Enterobacter cancerogenus]|uniref:Uncharacterized protein n=1 Tax=Enterobacter cancerogenus TaxID=69218 RepID=A0A484WZP4_9ENTR|nr:Uncharacterised protein [Enterobacter cancerogenus]
MEHLRFGFVALGRILHLRERQLGLRLMQLCHGQPKLGLRLVALRGGIARIDNHQHITFLHALVIAHPQLGDIARRFGGDGHHVAVGKGVVRGLFVTG